MSSLPTERNYKAAIDILNSRRRGKRPTVPSVKIPPFTNSSSIPDPKEKAGFRGTPSIVGMKEWFQQIGHSTADTDRLNIIHVACTEGKGSTCASTESFLRAHGQRTGFPRKTGLYTSPHLTFHEQRIRINFQPIARYFRRIFLPSLGCIDKSRRQLRGAFASISPVTFSPVISRVHQRGRRGAIFKTHHGGEYDATNVIEHPVVTVITPLGLDHVEQLGPSFENIAWHKAGIFKSGSTAVSSLQNHPDAGQVLRNRANEEAVKLHFVEKDVFLPPDTLQLTPDVQRMNCSVALAAVRQFLVEMDAASLMSQDIQRGVDQFSWPGRFQVLPEGRLRCFLDGAHYEMSVGKAAEWFIQNSGGRRILIFSQVSKARDTAIVLKRLAMALGTVHIQHVIFSRYDPQQQPWVRLGTQT